MESVWRSPRPALRPLRLQNPGELLRPWQPPGAHAATGSRACADWPRVRRRCLANSGQEDIAKAPTWGDTLSGAAFWANPNHWEQYPATRYWVLTFILLKIVGTIGGYRGRAAFARRSGLRPLLQKRKVSADAVDATFAAHVGAFPQAAAHLRRVDQGREPLAVVLPAFGRCEQDVQELRQTLAALARQTRPPDVVVLVDDAAPQDLSPALDGWPEASRLAYVRMTKNTGPAGARSVGLRLLRRWAGERRKVVVCLTDSDAAPDARWCEAMLEAQTRTPGIVSGVTLSSVECHTGRFHDHFGSLNGRWRWEDARGELLYGCTCNMSVDLAALGDLEFDPVFSRPGFEDIELCWRARKEKGVKVKYCEEAVVYHEYDRGLLGLYRQFWKYGNTEPIMAWMHPDFSFQGSRTVTLGFGPSDPRTPESWTETPSWARTVARAVDEAARSFAKFSGTEFK